MWPAGPRLHLDQLTHSGDTPTPPVKTHLSRRVLLFQIWSIAFQESGSQGSSKASLNLSSEYRLTGLIIRSGRDMPRSVPLGSVSYLRLARVLQASRARREGPIPPHSSRTKCRSCIATHLSVSQESLRDLIYRACRNSVRVQCHQTIASLFSGQGSWRTTCLLSFVMCSEEHSYSWRVGHRGRGQTAMKYKTKEKKNNNEEKRQVKTLSSDSSCVARGWRHLGKLPCVSAVMRRGFWNVRPVYHKAGPWGDLYKETQPTAALQQPEMHLQVLSNSIHKQTQSVKL